ncbi:hypothetical protein AVEN_130706-1 [Araneus ventricosus]|uniref:Uncharacterized protein n=1 Tax=Araneus ventricosus TaxID=182803 RepID=A0A4Y2FBE3_ARAVE|nr:hypothetical protein AVEN_130706-1 [Araneus ventricosus]
MSTFRLFQLRLSFENVTTLCTCHFRSLSRIHSTVMDELGNFDLKLSSAGHRPLVQGFMRPMGVVFDTEFINTSGSGALSRPQGPILLARVGKFRKINHSLQNFD